MSEFFLDLENRSRVSRFIIEFLPFASDALQSDVQKIIQINEKDPTSISEEELANQARALAVSIWPVRYAIEFYLESEPKKEWKILFESISPETKNHLQKLQKEFPEIESLERFLESTDIDDILTEDEKLEIESVRKEARLVIYKKETSIEKFISKGEEKRDEYMQRFDDLRELASVLTGALQDEAFAKLRHFEDRILFDGENIPLEILDQEIAYYREQKELTVDEG